MARSTGILLAAGGIGAGNEWLHGHVDTAVKISVGTLVAAVVFAGIEKLPAGEPFAVGVSIIALISVIIGPVTPGVRSPALQILDALGYGSPEQGATPKGH